jgi:50S ribosomal subunit-associated GTPase HflX
MDMGGQEKYRKEWMEHVTACDVVIFVVDGADKEREEEARSELHKLVGDAAFQKSPKPLMVCVNKIDLLGSMKREEAISLLHLEKLGHPYAVCDVSAKENKNIMEVVKFLTKRAK